MVDARPELLAKLGSVIVQIILREDAPVALERLEEHDRRRYGSVKRRIFMTAEDLAAADEDDGARRMTRRATKRIRGMPSPRSPEEDDEA